MIELLFYNKDKVLCSVYVKAGNAHFGAVADFLRVLLFLQHSSALVVVESFLLYNSQQQQGLK